LQALAARLAWRILELQIDRKDLFLNAYGSPVPALTGTLTTYFGHIDKAERRARNLRNFISRVDNLPCTVPGWIRQIANENIPTFPDKSK
jgi:hypothetical protein